MYSKRNKISHADYFYVDIKTTIKNYQMMFILNEIMAKKANLFLKIWPIKSTTDEWKVKRDSSIKFNDSFFI